MQRLAGPSACGVCMATRADSTSNWTLQIGPLLEAGYRVVAPDLKGAVGGESDVPTDVAAYDIPTGITKDLIGLHSITRARSHCWHHCMHACISTTSSLPSICLCCIDCASNAGGLLSFHHTVHLVRAKVCVAAC